MFIILVRVHPNTTKLNIINFISPYLKGGLFAPNGVLGNINIMVLRDSLTKATEYYAIVQVGPDDKTSLRVIHKLNRKKLNGKPINVRQYHIRNRNNDPRLKNKCPAAPIIKEKRLSERRRDLLEKLETVKFEGDAQYAQIMRERVYF